MPIKYSSRWRTILRWVFVLGIMALSVQAGRLVHLQIKARTDARAARVGRPIPYTVTLREIVHGPDGTTNLGPEYTYAVRSDGTTLMRWVGRSSQRLLYFPSGLQVDTNDGTNTKSSMMLPNLNPARLQRNPVSNCLNSMAGMPMTSPPETFLGEEIVAGYRTAKIADGLTTSWHALDYGCALVKDRWDFSATEVSEKELVALFPGEPDKALFDVPAHYREVLPSERLLGPKRECLGCNENSDKFLQTLDEDYRRLAAKPQ
jgi:hypothetical protein